MGYSRDHPAPRRYLLVIIQDSFRSHGVQPLRSLRDAGVFTIDQVSVRCRLTPCMWERQVKSVGFMSRKVNHASPVARLLEAAASVLIRPHPLLTLGRRRLPA